VEGVGKQFGGDEIRLREFVAKTRDYGKGELEVTVLLLLSCMEAMASTNSALFLITHSLIGRY
jgi:hypothetical protein